MKILELVTGKLSFTKLGFSKLAIYVTLAGMAAMFLLPAWFAFVNSLKSLGEIQAGNLLYLPQVWTIEGWRKAWSGACTGASSCAGLAPYFKNSFIVVIPATLLSTLWACFNGYILSKWRFRGADLVFFVLLFGSFLPWGLYLLPLTRIVDWLGLSNSLLGLILVHLMYSLPLTLFFRNHFVGFPDDLIKAARIDGAGLFTIFWRIVLPTCKPMFVVVLIMQFTAIWNDFMFSLVLSPSHAQPVTVGLNNLTNSQTGSPEYNVYMAAAFITSLPTIVVYILAGKYFVRGLTAGAVKG